jgi:hypothetical protein
MEHQGNLSTQHKFHQKPLYYESRLGVIVPRPVDTAVQKAVVVQEEPFYYCHNGDRHHIHLWQQYDFHSHVGYRSNHE